MYIGEEEGCYRNGKSAQEKLQFCIDQLKKADGFKEGIEWTTEIVPRLTVEEMVGAILHAREEVEIG